jgi:hypothetical protein
LGGFLFVEIYDFEPVTDRRKLPAAVYGVKALLGEHFYASGMSML